jgi:hypothetical protein
LVRLRGLDGLAQARVCAKTAADLSPQFTLPHIPHLQESTSAITCSCLQRVIAVFGHLRVIGAYFEKCSIDKSAVSTDYCFSQTGAPSESNRAFVVIEHSLLQVNHPQRSRREENTQEPGKGCGMWGYERFFSYADWNISLAPGIYNGREHHLRGALSRRRFRHLIVQSSDR